MRSSRDGPEGFRLVRRLEELFAELIRNHFIPIALDYEDRYVDIPNPSHAVVAPQQ
jgi:hypothetical protein